MTTSRREANKRRTLVNLSVVAGSAAVLAASWLGVVHTDTDGDAEAANVAAAPVTSEAVARADGDSRLTPAPAPRRVVVVRESRAS